jgi:ferredoxin
VTYVITGECIGTKDQSCVAVCPVECIHPLPGDADFEGSEQLYIDPDECIDCNACTVACPVDAPVRADELTDEQFPYRAANARYFANRGA